MTFKIIRPQAIAETTEFSRAFTATYYDEDGVLQTAAIDVPRLSYDPSDLTLAPTWLFEDAAENRVVRSQEFSNASWAKSQSSVTADVATAPDGTLTADKLVEDATNNQHFVSQTNTAASLPDSVDATVSVYVKAAERTWAQIVFANTDVAVSRIWFDLATGEIGTQTLQTGVSATIQSLPDGWYRISVTGGTGSGGASMGLRIQVNTADNQTAYLGDGLSGIYVWGGQFEIASEATSYIPTVAATVTRAADIPGDMLTSSVPEDDYAEYDAGTAYGLGDFVISTTTHRVYESLQAGNIGNPLPAADEVSTEWWLNVSATNRWKMFDNSITSQTTASDVLATAIQTVGRVDSIAVLNASGRSARFLMIDATEGTVYDQTYSLIDDSGITDYYEYFFEPVTSVPNFSVQDLPLYANAQIQVIVENAGGTVLLGALIVGLSRTFGETEIGASLGITDYSVKITDDFGNKTVLERAFNDVMEVQVLVDNANLDALKVLLASLRATPIVYIGSATYGSMIVYGYFQDFRYVIAYPTYSLLNIEIEGLT